MRTIHPAEQRFVSGAGDEDQTSLMERGLDLCEGMPDDKIVTLTLDHTDSLGVSSTGGSETETITFELSCGGLRDAAESAS